MSNHTIQSVISRYNKTNQIKMVCGYNNEPFYNKKSINFLKL